MSVFKQKIVLILGEPDEVTIAAGKKLVETGAVITLCGNNDSGQLEDACTNISHDDSDTDWIHSVLPSTEDAKKIITYMIDKYGRLDTLIANLTAHPNMQKHNGNGLDTTPHQVVLSTMRFVEQALPVLQENTTGRIINVGSIDYLGCPEKAGLSSAYSSLFGLTRSLAIKVAKKGVTVNLIMVSDIENSSMTDEERESKLPSIPVKRIGHPDDVANAINYFAADDAKYVTGQTFFVCGGKSIHYSMSI